MLQFGGKNILIDVSPDFLEQAKRARLKKIDAVFITHGHDDAYGGLSDLKKWLARNSHPPILVFSHSSTLKYIKKLLPSAAIPKPSRPFSRTTLFGKKISFIPVRHGLIPLPTYGFLFGRDLFYASDMDRASARARRIIKNTKTVILDGAFWNIKRLRGHFTAPDTINFAKELHPKKLFITQSGHSYPPHEKAQRELKKIAKTKSCRFPVQLAYDGLKISIK